MTVALISHLTEASPLDGYLIMLGHMSSAIPGDDLNLEELTASVLRRRPARLGFLSLLPAA